MEGHRVAILSPYLAFAPAHVVRSFTTVALSKDGAPYLSPGTPAWVRFKNGRGEDQEERGSDHNIHHVNELGDAWYGAPYRAFPAEAVTPIASVIKGDVVLVDSIHSGARVQAEVLSVMDGQYAVTSFPSRTESDGKLGDSGSPVWTQDGRLVGFVSALNGVVVIPDMRSLTGTKPAPVPAPPTPVAAPAPVVAPTHDPVPVAVTLSVEAAYANGKADGYRDAVNKFRAIANAL